MAAMRFALFTVALLFQAAPKHVVYVVDKVQQISHENAYGSVGDSVQGEHHTAPVVMGEFSKRCPDVLFTRVRENADLILETQTGGSVLSNAKGDVLYTSPAKTLGNMAKDVCRYISAH